MAGYKKGEKLTCLLVAGIMLAAGPSCSSAPRIKPNPDPETLSMCPSCKGLGRIETISSAEPIKDVRMTPGEKETAGFFANITNNGWCLFNIFSSSGLMASKVQSEYDQELMEKKERIEREEMMHDRSRGSYVKHMTECPRCKGVGWIDPGDTGRSILEKTGKNEPYKRANEMIDR